MKGARWVEVHDDIPGRIYHGNRRRGLRDRHGFEVGLFNPLEDKPLKRRCRDYVETSTGGDAEPTPMGTK